MICRIADFNIDFKNPTSEMQNFLSGYSSNEKADFRVAITKEDFEDFRKILPSASSFQLEMNTFHNKLLEILPLYDALFLHASLIEVSGQGIAFTALSGTGKSTHTLLWQKLLGDKMKIINGDKPIIRFIDGIPFGYGTPWNGKEGLGTNSRTPIKHICFIERSEQNLCEQIDPQTVLNRIFSQIFVPKDSIAAANTLSLLNRLLGCCTIWNIKCNTDTQAAQTAFNTIFKEN